MTTYLNDPASSAVQALRQSLGARGAFFSNGGTPHISPHQKNFIEEITLRHLNTPSKIEKVQSLRDHIKLPSGFRDAQFFEQEKKETNLVLCLRSNFRASTLAP
ncbi:hypothetical protein [Polaromonas sp. A23]|uniref:hypothetical protein n=1 Tax=Polaromonas sp. A23 TaxID=1944133 RepID=UPI001115699C|nr:hypothetical protein [Polaromonas sp. A23]